MYSFTEFKPLFKVNYKQSNYLHTYIMYPIALVLSFLFLRIKITPNGITTLSLILGLIGIYYFEKNFVFASLLLFISYVIDYTDGVIARITKNTSNFGALYDVFVDRVIQMAFWLNILYITGFDLVLPIAVVIIFSNTNSFAIGSKVYLDKKQIAGSVILKIKKIIFIFGDPGFSYFMVPILYVTPYFKTFILIVGAFAFVRTIWLLGGVYMTSRK